MYKKNHFSDVESKITHGVSISKMSKIWNTKAKPHKDILYQSNKTSLHIYMNA